MDKLIQDFGINWTSVLFYTVNFLILFFILSKFLFKPVNKMLDERQKMSKELVTNLKKSREDLESLELRIQENLKQSNLQSQEILEEAKKSAQDIIQAANLESQKKSEKMLEDTKKRMEEEKTQMINEVKGEILNEAKVLFKQLVGTMPSSDHQKLVDETIRKVQ